MNLIKYGSLIFVNLIFFSQVVYSQPAWFKEAVYNSKNLEVHPDAPAVTLLDYGSAEISEDLSAKIKLRIIHKILTQKGEHYAVFSFPSNPTRKLNNLNGWIYKTNGTYESLEDDNIIETSATEDAMYYDRSKMIHANFPGVKPGVVVGYEYEIEEDEWTSLFQAFVFQGGLPVKLVKYNITIPEGWQLIKSEWKMDGIEYSQADQKYSWEGKNLPYRPEEPLSPSSNYLSKRLFVTAYDPNRVGANQFENWEQVGNWCYNLFREQIVPNPEIIETVNKLTKDMTSVEDKINAIAEFIQKEIRYVAIEIGKGRWQPRKAQITFDNHYGDCKDKTTLMCTMLKTLDIKSFPVLVNTSIGIDDKVPTPFQFNHAILGIPVKGLDLSDNLMNSVIGGFLYFDPTSESIPFGELPPELLGRRILIGAHEDSLFRSLDYPKPEARRQVFHLIGKIEEDGSFNAKVNVANFDVLANNEKVQQRYLSVDDQKKKWETNLTENIPILSISNFQCYDHNDSVGVTFDISGNGLIQVSGDLVLFKPDLFSKSGPNPLFAAYRESPVWLGVAKESKSNILWNLPESFVPEVPEYTIIKECDECKIDLNLVIKNQQLKLKTKKVIQGRLIDKEKYNEVKEFTNILSHVNSYTALFTNKQ
jgi:hypothetical protein